MTKRRVVVTGMGMLSPIGNDVATSWENALAGKSGAGPIAPGQDGAPTLAQGGHMARVRGAGRGPGARAASPWGSGRTLLVALFRRTPDMTPPPCAQATWAR